MIKANLPLLPLLPAKSEILRVKHVLVFSRENMTGQVSAHHYIMQKEVVFPFVWEGKVIQDIALGPREWDNY